jgi:hypothetical protein
MQTVRNVLRIDGAEAKITDVYGADARTPVLVIGTRPLLEFDLRTTERNPATGELVPYPAASFDDIGSYYFALDGDFDQDTPPNMLVLAGISVAEVDGKTILTAQLPNTDNAAVRAALATAKTVTLQAEIGGFDTAPECAFAFQFDLAVRNRVYIAGDPPAEDEASDYYTIAETEAAISRQLVFEFAETADGPWHSDMVAGTDLYIRVRHGATGLPSAASPIPYGPDGEDGATFTPSLTDGVLSWTNDKGLANPDPVDLNPEDGEDGATFIPSFTDGVLSWTNNKGLANPDPVDLNPEDGDDGVTFTPSFADGVLSWTNNGGLANPAPLDFAELTGERVTTPAGTTVLGQVYRRTADGWQTADPDDLACETALLWIAQGTNATDGMRAEAVVTNPAWSWTGIPGTAVWLGEDGAITETFPTEESHIGKFGRQVGWVESATSIRFYGKLQAVYYPGAVS